VETWLVAEGGRAALLPAALGRAWRGGAAAVAELALPARRQPCPLLFAWPDPAPEALARAPRWPDVLADWSEVYGDRLFPGDALPALAEALSGLGADVLVLHAEPGLRAATAAWYERGALALYEHVGGGTVSWSEPDGLGRPADGTLLGAAASFALDRIELQNRATGEVIVTRALHRFLAAAPPPLDELAGMVARAPHRRFPA
jgi:hypothetical protein